MRPIAGLMHRRPRAIAIAIATLSIGWLVALPPTPSSAAIRIDRTWTLGSGVTLTRWYDPTGPIHAFVLKFKPDAAPATFDVGMPAEQLPGEAPTSRIGASHRALAAVNGDFGHDRPYHATAADGVLWQSGPMHGEAFAVAAGERNVFVGKGRPHVTAGGPTGTFRINRWNSGSPRGSEIAGYTPRGGSLEDPPGNACSVRMKQQDRAFWTRGKEAVGRSYVVEASRCSADPLPEQGMTVLSVKQSAPNRQLQRIKDLRAGQTVRVRWSMGWPNVLDTIGGRPMLVENGRNVAPTSCTGPLCGKHPRTAVGVDERGNVLLVVVDGRIDNWSIGMYLNQLGGFFANELNASFAMNLDGGGSATMWVAKDGPWCSPKPTGVTNGCIVNYANPGGNFKERPAENAALILPGPDPGEQPPPSGP
jgi:hypothetical protein